MKTLLLIVVVFLAGCTSFQSAGVATYTVKPIVTETQIVCCEVTVMNGKEYASLKAHIEKRGDNYAVDLEEQVVAAFKGQEITATAVKFMIEDALKASAAAALSPVIPVLGK